MNIGNIYISHKVHTYFTIAVVILLLALTPLTIFFAKQQQNSQSNAAGITKLNIYLGSLTPGWRDWSSNNADVSLSSRKVLYQNYHSISFIAQGKGAQLYLHTRSAIDTSYYTHVNFVIQASQANQMYRVALTDTNDNIIRLLPLSSYQCNPVISSWSTCNVPLFDLGAYGRQIRGFILQEAVNAAEPVVYVNNISLLNEINTTPVPIVTSPATPTVTQIPIPTIIGATPIPTAKPSPTPTSLPTFTPIPTPTSSPVSGMWKPTSSIPLHWQYQLGTAFTYPNDVVTNVNVYDIDGVDNNAQIVSSLHSIGAKVICYIDVGTWENWRSDANSFPSSVKGSSNGWPGEQWLDIRQISILQPIMQARFQTCKNNGFDAIDPDNMDGYSNSTGFPLTAQDQINYDTIIANLAHQIGLSVGLKNDTDQITQLQPYFDWMVDESCYEYSECNTLQPFINANKAVFEVEYNNNTNQCSSLNAQHVNSTTRDKDLVSPSSSGYVRKACVPDTQNTW